jgi:sugar (pentulose or hexulose) kinase
VGHRGISPQSAVSKWRWFQRHESALWRRSRRVQTLSDYFTYSLTGERVGDAGTAAFLGLYDLHRQEWWPAALAAFEIPREKLSTPLLPGTRCGRTTAHASDLLGLPPGIPFAVGSLDHHAGALGAGLGPLARVSTTTGTVLAVLTVIDHVTAREDCYHGLQVDRGSYYCLAFDSAGAGRLEEYHRQHAPELTLDQLLQLAATPTENHGRAAQCLLLEIAARHRRLVDRVAGARFRGNILATGGGSRSPLLLQIMANTLECPVVTSRPLEAGCLGAALFAAVAAGHFARMADAQQAMVHAGSSFLPESGASGEPNSTVDRQGIGDA